MTNKDIKQRKSIIAEYYDKEDFGLYADFARELLNDLHKEKHYNEIVDLVESEYWDKHIVGNTNFIAAFAYNETGKKDKAQILYEEAIEFDKEDYASMNNLSLIYEKNKEISKAVKLIKRANKLVKTLGIESSENIENNYDRILKQEADLKNKNELFKIAAAKVSNENNYVKDKLKYFIKLCKTEVEFKNGYIPIPNWKFKVLIGASEEKADSLKRQWIDKNYLEKTDEKQGYTIIYRINPEIEKVLNSLPETEQLSDWANCFNELDVPKLEEINYFDTIGLLNKIAKKYKSVILRDYNELVLNYVFKNYKSVIILSGSLVELLLIYNCEKKKITQLSFTKNARPVNINIYDATLNDLLLYYEENKQLSTILINLGDIARLYRNYIHPGKELKEVEVLDKTKSELSFLSVNEIIRKVV